MPWVDRIADRRSWVILARNFSVEKVKNDRQAKSCGKDGQKAPLEIKKRFPLFAQLQQQQA